MSTILIIFFASLLAGISFLLSLVAKFIISMLLGLIQAVVSKEVLCLIIGFVAVVVLFFIEEGFELGPKDFIESFFGVCLGIVFIIAVLALFYVIGGWIVVMAGSLFAGVILVGGQFVIEAVYLFAVWQENIYIKMFETVKQRLTDLYKM